MNHLLLHCPIASELLSMVWVMPQSVTDYKLARSFWQTSKHRFVEACTTLCLMVHLAKTELNIIWDRFKLPSLDIGISLFGEPFSSNKLIPCHTLQNP